ncbi:MAG: hypothetical protein K1X28_09100 [Parachlamydiales bacterium]|nr:hypothetical protein [Parachlamydiales bacterium]
MELNKTLTNVEKTFNFVDSIPVVGIFSSALRISAAKIQIFVSAIVGLFGLIGQLVSSNVRKWEEITQKAGEHLLHGALNFIRGVGEFLLALTIVGSIGLLAYQHYSENKFEPIIPYSEPPARPAEAPEQDHIV